MCQMQWYVLWMHVHQWILGGYSHGNLVDPGLVYFFMCSLVRKLWNMDWGYLLDYVDWVLLEN